MSRSFNKLRPKAVILAAGFGTRLRPLTDTTPKALLPVGGVPLIHHCLRLLQQAGVTEVIINLHHLGKQIEQNLGTGHAFGMNICYSWEEKILGTGGGTKRSASLFEDSPFFVINSDILIHLPLQRLWDFHQKKGGIATMVVMPRPPQSPHSWLQCEQGRVTKISSEPALPPHAYLYTGIQILERRFLDYLPEGPCCLVADGYQKALMEQVNAFVYRGYWNDLGDRERLEEAQLTFPNTTG